jgi:hypothetical protein
MSSGFGCQTQHPLLTPTIRLSCRLPGANHHPLTFMKYRLPLAAAEDLEVQAVTGHAPDSSGTGAVYRSHITEKVFREVADHGRGWLFDRDAPDRTSALGAGLARLT